MPAQKKHNAKYQLAIQVKEIAADGSFEGILSSYNTVDLGGDSILPGAFTKTIQEHGSVIPLLWQHKTDEPIGSLTLIDAPDALRVKGQLVMELPMAQKAYLLLKARIIKGLSIGYDTIKDSMEKNVRVLKELRLWEGSVVTFPMNELAMVTGIKSKLERKEDFTGELLEVQLQDAGYQMMCALARALQSVVWATLAKEEKITAAETTLSQFTDAYLAYLPMYLDFLTEEYGEMELMQREQMAVKARLDISAILAATKDMGVERLVLDTKEGRTLSASTLKSLKAMHGHVKDLDSILTALRPVEADDDSEDDSEDDDTSKSKAAAGNTEPVQPDHSAALGILDSILSTISPPK